MTEPFYQNRPGPEADELPEDCDCCDKVEDCGCRCHADFNWDDDRVFDTQREGA